MLVRTKHYTISFQSQTIREKQMFRCWTLPENSGIREYGGHVFSHWGYIESF